MNGPKLRSSQGCWTCRLRRKKCDEARPVCAACDSLQINCHYSDTKPEWMDGGVREKQMADELKVMVKKKAMERREKKWSQLPTLADLSPSSHPQQQQNQPQQQQEPQVVDHPMEEAGDPSPSDNTSGSGSGTPPSETTPLSRAETNDTSRGSSSPPPSSVPSWRAQIRPVTDSFPENKSEVEVSFTMIYLDHVVPFLFPFYRPCLLQSSRGWMLVLLMKNRALFHTALSLANWLFAVVLDSMDGTHGDCKLANWAELQAHQETAIQALQADIRALNERGVANAFRESISCLQSVVQLLEFEAAMADASSWPVHHDAAVVLFDELVTHHASAADRAGAPTTPWASILDRIGGPYRRIPLGAGRQLLTSDQSAYQFYTAYLLWIDVIAATANGEVPRLRKHHAELLAGDVPRVLLDEYVGCYSWAVLEVAEVARLAAWKREQQSNGSLSMVDLVKQLCVVRTRLLQRMETLSPPPSPSSCSSSCPSAADHNRASNIYDPSAHHPVTPYSGFHEMHAMSLEAHRGSPAVDLHTRIWAQATITYLFVVASGLQPTLPEIRASVGATIDLFRALPSPLAVRTLVWPFAVTGCLCLKEQEPFFVGLVDAMGAMQVFGTVKEALRIMQVVWKLKDDQCIEPQMWDIATCFSLLGHRSLLI
ncbi:fungal-specific transcription factor domain-containing protein [Nemania sp. NC0429]|nr:fungal-specific transcription factor domain-containing protein [Nemania sp. NC0429]